MDSKFKYKYYKYKSKYLKLKGGRKTLLLTGPHAFCNKHNINKTISETGHYCDSIVDKTLLLFREKFTEKFNYSKNIKIISNNKLRSDCDMNRFYCNKEKIRETRNEKFRQDITKELETTNIYFLLDIHSFPKDTENKNHDMYILWQDEQQRYADDLILYITQHTENTNINIGIYKGENNDIIKEAHEKKIPALLLEFKEIDLQNNNEIENRNIIISLVIDWVVQYDNTN